MVAGTRVEHGHGTMYNHDEHNEGKVHRGGYTNGQCHGPGESIWMESSPVWAAVENNSVTEFNFKGHYEYDQKMRGEKTFKNRTTAPYGTGGALTFEGPPPAAADGPGPPAPPAGTWRPPPTEAATEVEEVASPTAGNGVPLARPTLTPWGQSEKREDGSGTRRRRSSRCQRGPMEGLC